MTYAAMNILRTAHIRKTPFDLPFPDADGRSAGRDTPGMIARTAPGVRIGLHGSVGSQGSRHDPETRTPFAFSTRNTPLRAENVESACVPNRIFEIPPPLVVWLMCGLRDGCHGMWPDVMDGRLTPGEWVQPVAAWMLWDVL